MATRAEMQRRKRELSDELRRMCVGGDSTPRTLLPPVRELAARFDMSRHTAMGVVEELEAEGLLHSVRGHGTFVGGRERRTIPPFLVVRDERAWSENERAQYSGFTEQLSRFGAHSFSLPIDVAYRLASSGALPTCSGVYASTLNYKSGDTISYAPGIPYVGLMGHSDRTISDVVDFDNHGGGQRACYYLHEQGHSRIGYVGFHASRGEPPWSAERASGWAEAMEALDLPSEGLLILNEHEEPGEEVVGKEAADRFLTMAPISALVFANDMVAHSFFGHLRERGIPPSMWPACVGFDDVPTIDGQVLCSIRLPWAELGREAARVLWARVNGTLTGPTALRRLPMQLIPRLSGQSGWAHEFSFTIFSRNSKL